MIVMSLTLAFNVQRCMVSQGHLPQRVLLQKYKLLQFEDISKAVRYAPIALNVLLLLPPVVKATSFCWPRA